MNSEPATPRLAWSLLQPDWLEVCKAARQPAFRARQIWKWLYQERVDNWESMTNLPAAWRKELAVSHPLTPWAAEERQVADDGVTKLLLTCRDGQAIETVLIPADERLTLCVSTQAGCAFGCAFCATGRGGYVRDLDAGEIVGQYMAASRAAAPRRITNLVVMGMGEPFANYDATLRAVRIFNDYDGIGIGARRITLSTCGVVPGIRRLAARICRSSSPSHSTPPRMSCARGSCRSTASGLWPSCWKPAPNTQSAPDASSPLNTPLSTD
jgi:23S rRNA (adenine2503-C2)-methyltransferase